MFHPIFSTVLFIVLLSLVSAHSSIPPVKCKTHLDCRSSAILVTGTPPPATLQLPEFDDRFAQCDRGTCKSLLEGFPCENPNWCGIAHSCLHGKCVIGGQGAPCKIHSENCMPGFACDEITEKCVLGIQGTMCRTKDECGFGNSCYLEPTSPDQIPKTGGPWVKRAKRRGVCKPGVENSFACRRDNHCVKGLKCVRSASSVYKCAVPTNFSRTMFPEGFRACVTSAGCPHDMSCEQGKCQPKYLGQLCLKNQWERCSIYTACVNRRCMYRREGDPCKSVYGGSEWDQCAPGFQCNANRNVGYGQPGKCVRGVEGMKCYDQRECESGLVCGTSGKCIKSAEWQRCRSNFWCPRGALCRKSSNQCTFDTTSVASYDKYPEVDRPKECKWKTDCAWAESCRNGICLPKRLAWVCNVLKHHSPMTRCVGGIDVENTLGDSCSNKSGCVSGLACVRGKCALPGSDSTCFSDDSCPKGEICRNHNCRKAKYRESCVSDSSCAKGLSCVPGAYSTGYCTFK